MSDPADILHMRLQKEERFPRGPEFPVCLFIERGGAIFPATGLQFAQDPEGKEISEIIRLPQESAQALFDDMVKAGFRPSAKPNLEGIIGAKQQHIDDLRDALMTVLGKPCQKST
jgi:hypothetical protein